MRCEEVREILSLYIDNELNEEESSEIEKHLETCEECNREYEDLLTIKKLLTEIPQVQLPDNFKQDLHKKLVECISEESNEIEENNAIIDSREKPNKTLARKKKFNWKVMSGVAAAVFLMVVSAASLMNNNLKMDDMSRMEMEKAAPENNMSYKMAKEEIRRSEGISGEAPQNDNGNADEINTYGFGTSKVQEAPRMTQNIKLNTESIDSKIILNGYVNLGVENYDLAYKNIEKSVVSRGGYVQRSNVAKKQAGESNKYLKTGNITIRIPRNEFKNTLSEIGNNGTVIDQRETTNDVSILYNDASNKLSNLENDESNIIKSLDEEESDENSKLETQKELARVREEIDDLKSSIGQWNNLIKLPVIDVTLKEVDKDTKEQD